VTLNWETSSQHAHNVMHFEAPTATEADVFAAFTAHRTTAMWAPVADVAVITSLDIIKLDGTSSSLSFDTGGGSGWHSTAGSAWLPQGSGIIKLATGLRGRSNRGRVYLPFLAESSQSSGFLDPGITTPTTAAWVTFANDMASDNAALGVASYKNATWHQAVNVICESATGTQRRRQRQNRS
jgi:hypothetical protein